MNKQCDEAERPSPEKDNAHDIENPRNPNGKVRRRRKKHRNKRRKDKSTPCATAALVLGALIGILVFAIGGFLIYKRYCKSESIRSNNTEPEVQNQNGDIDWDKVHMIKFQRIVQGQPKWTEFTKTDENAARIEEHSGNPSDHKIEYDSDVGIYIVRRPIPHFDYEGNFMLYVTNDKITNTPYWCLAFGYDHNPPYTVVPGYGHPGQHAMPYEEGKLPAINTQWLEMTPGNDANLEVKAPAENTSLSLSAVEVVSE